MYLIQWYETCEAFLLVIPDQNQCFDGTLWTILSTDQLHYSKLGEGEGGGGRGEGGRERESKMKRLFFKILYIFDVSGHETPEHCDGLRVLYQELESHSLHYCLLELHQVCNGVLNQKNFVGIFVK